MPDSDWLASDRRKARRAERLLRRAVLPPLRAIGVLISEQSRPPDDGRIGDKSLIGLRRLKCRCIKSLHRFTPFHEF